MNETTLRDRIRIVEMEYRGTFGIKFKSKVEGILVCSSKFSEGILDTALSRLQAAGVTAETPTWEIADMLKRLDSGEKSK